MPGKRESAASAQQIRGRLAALLLLLTLSMVIAGCGGRISSTSGARGRFTGKITSSATGAILEAKVKVDGTVYSTVTGVFLSDYLAYGSHTVIVSAEGYQPQTTSVNLSRASSRIDFTLQVEPDVTPPSVLSVVPGQGATGVGCGIQPVTTFSESMDEATVEGAVTLTPAAPFILDWLDAARTQLALIPAAPLSPETEYTITIGASARDRSGNTMGLTKQVSFRTGSSVGGPGRVAFVSDPSPYFIHKIYLAPESGVGQPVALIPDWNEDDQPAWSPDGTRLVFSSRRGASTTTSQLYTTAVNTPNPRQVITGSRYDEARPKWSPDGGWIAFSSVRPPDNNWGIFVVPVDATGKATGGPLQVNLDPGGPSGGATDESPEWSPDGTVLLFTSNRASGRLIYAVDLQDLGKGGLVGEQAGRSATCLTPDGIQEEDPAWAPVSTGGVWRVAYASYRDDNPGQVANWDIWLMDVSLAWGPGGQRTVLATNHRRITNSLSDEYSPVWSPDGTQLLFVSGQAGGATELHRIMGDGSGETAFTAWAGKQFSPAWSSR